MTNKKVIHSNEVTRLIRDPTVVRIVSIIGITSLSILESPEYNLTWKAVNYVLSYEVIAIDKSSSPSSSRLNYPNVTLDENNVPVCGDNYFYNFPV